MVFNHGIHRIHGTLVSLVLLFGVVVSAVAAEPGITVEARQRYPWNGLVDLKFTITGESGTKYDTSFVAKDMVGGTNIAMKTIRKSNGVVAEEKEKLLPGTYNWVWDAAADLPKDFKCERMTVTGNAEQSQGLYMVIDLSSGANSSKYPVSYLDAVPSGGWGNVYKTTKMVLRWCSKGKDPKGRYTLTKDFYIGVFEVTCKQYYLVMGAWPRGHGESDASQPAEYITWNIARGNNWPSDVSPASNSFSGKLRSRTGMFVDLPTEAQWEYACRAGTTSSFNNGGSTEADLKMIGRYIGNCKALVDGTYIWCTSVVGSYKANAWGIFDMHGNLWELCLNWHGGNSLTGIDPKGVSSGIYRVSRGGSFDQAWDCCTSSFRIQGSTGEREYEDGFRMCINLTE